MLNTFIDIDTSAKYSITNTIATRCCCNGMYLHISNLKNFIIRLYKAIDQASGEIVVIKSLKGGDMGMEEKGGKLIENEYKSLQELNNPYIVQCFSTGIGQIVFSEKNTGIIRAKTKPQRYVVLEYLMGRTLLERLKTTEFPEEFARKTMKYLLEGLYNIHSHNLAHRDIKLENIMFGPDGKPKFIDFGLAGKLEGHNKTGLFYDKAGSMYYWAPEIICLDGHYGYDGVKADIFALGVVFFEMIFKTLPFGDYPSPEIISALQNDDYWEALEMHMGMKKIDIDLKDLLKRMLSPYSEERPTETEIAANPWMTRK